MLKSDYFRRYYSFQRGVIVVIILGYNWVLSFKTGQAMMQGRKKKFFLRVWDSAQLYDNHLLLWLLRNVPILV